MVDVLASIQSAINIVGRLKALSKKVEDAEFAMLLADLTDELANSKLELAHFKNQLAEALEECQRLKERQNQSSMTKPSAFDGGYRFENEDGLFCTACFDAREQKIRLVPHSATFKALGKWKCPVCKVSFS